MSSPAWPREKVELLIEEYRKRPVLWNSKLKIYHNRKLRDEAYAELGEILGETKEGLTKKINNVRSQYLQEIKKTLRVQECDENNTYTSSWWAFERLHFLKEYDFANENEGEEEPSSPSTSTYIIRLNNDIASAENSNEMAEIEEVYCPPGEISPSNIDIKSLAEISKRSPKRKKRKVQSIPSYSIVSAPKEPVMPTYSLVTTTPTDSLDSYGKYLADEIRSIPDKQQQQLLKLKIQTMIYYAHKGWLQESDDS